MIWHFTFCNYLCPDLAGDQRLCAESRQDRGDVGRFCSNCRLASSGTLLETRLVAPLYSQSQLPETGCQGPTHGMYTIFWWKLFFWRTNIFLTKLIFLENKFFDEMFFLGRKTFLGQRKKNLLEQFLNVITDDVIQRQCDTGSRCPTTAKISQYNYAIYQWPV